MMKTVLCHSVHKWWVLAKVVAFSFVGLLTFSKNTGDCFNNCEETKEQYLEHKQPHVRSKECWCS